VSLLDNLRKRAAEQGLTGIDSLMPEEEPAAVDGVPDEDPWLFAIDRRQSFSEVSDDELEPEPEPSSFRTDDPPVDQEPIGDTQTGAFGSSGQIGPNDAAEPAAWTEEVIFASEAASHVEVPGGFDPAPDGAGVVAPFDDNGVGGPFDHGDVGAPFVGGGVGVPFDDNGVGAPFDDGGEDAPFPDMAMVYAGLSDAGISPIDDVDPPIDNVTGADSHSGSFEGPQPSITIEEGPIGPDALDPLAVLGLTVGASWADVASARRALLDSEGMRRPEINQAAATLRLLRAGPLHIH
jgi:hypothetical protein